MLECGRGDDELTLHNRKSPPQTYPLAGTLVPNPHRGNPLLAWKPRFSPLFFWIWKRRARHVNQADIKKAIAKKLKLSSRHASEIINL